MKFVNEALFVPFFNQQMFDLTRKMKVNNQLKFNGSIVLIK